MQENVDKNRGLNRVIALILEVIPKNAPDLPE